MRNVPAGINTCGIPSTVDTRSFTNSAVGKTSFVGVTVGTMLSTVEVTMAVGTSEGSGVDIDSTVGGAPAHAAKMNKRAGMIFFISRLSRRPRRQLLYHVSAVDGAES